MPGILPMKVIKVGSNTPSRIAQACDRCRSKKIRCDGIRPSCSQCLNVGFECKTSDKLSRRAFPRGYTESLEDRVRQLEGEIRELKDLLDEKDEKIDILSRIHPRSPRLTSPTPRSPTSNSPSPKTEQVEEPIEQDDSCRVQQLPHLLNDENGRPFFAGTSSRHALVHAFKSRAYEPGRSSVEVNDNALFAAESTALPPPRRPSVASWTIPPRLVSDQMINIFFQEWAPLFPVLHRPTALTLYERYVTDPETVQDPASLAQLHLIFGISAISGGSHVSEYTDLFESQWQAAIDNAMLDGTLETLQCLVLAQIYCMLKGDPSRLLKYKGVAVSLSHRLGLHQSQERFALGALALETRKKTFWTLYVLDCFSAAQLGLPKLLNEGDIQCEYPFDIDDEYVTEHGMMRVMSGESTKLSSALALFGVCRILGKVLVEMYPSSPTYQITRRKISALSEELDLWLNGLPKHLRLQFSQDKPSTNVISSRSPVLRLAYEYVRSLIHRPAVCAGLGERASSSIVALASSSKHIVQIIQLLDERNLSFALCLNKAELLTLSGLGILFQTLAADHDGKFTRDSHRLALTVADMLDRDSAPGAHEFRRLTSAILFPLNTASPRPPPTRPSSAVEMSAPHEAFRATQRHLKAIAARFGSSSRKHLQHDEPESPRTSSTNQPTMMSPMGHQRNPSTVSLSSIRSEPAPTGAGRSQLNVSSPPPTKSSKATHHAHATNLDYLSFSTDAHCTVPRRKTTPYRRPSAATSASTLPAYSSAQPRPSPIIPAYKPAFSPFVSDWEHVLGTPDHGPTDLYTIYGGGGCLPPDALSEMSPPPPTSSAAAGGAMPFGPHGDHPHHHQQYWDYLPADSPWSYEMVSASSARPPQSVLSVSDESLTSGGEELIGDFGGAVGGAGTRANGGAACGAAARGHPSTGSSDYGAFVMTEMASPVGNAGMALGSMDGNFGV